MGAIGVSNYDAAQFARAQVAGRKLQRHESLNDFDLVHAGGVKSE